MLNGHFCLSCPFLSIFGLSFMLSLSLLVVCVVFPSLHVLDFFVGWQILINSVNMDMHLDVITEKIMYIIF